MNLTEYGRDGDVCSPVPSASEIEVEVDAAGGFWCRNSARFSFDENGFRCRGFGTFLGGAGVADARISFALKGILGNIDEEQG